LPSPTLPISARVMFTYARQYNISALCVSVYVIFA